MPHLIEETLKQNPNLTFQQAVLASLKRIEGSYAFAIISTREPDKIICARNESPLVLGINGKGVFCASDIPAFLEVTNKAVMINNGELVILTADGYEIRRISDNSPVTRDPITVEWTAEMAVKQGYPHFMIKEIHEQPETLRNTLRIQDHYLDLLAQLSLTAQTKCFWLRAEQATMHVWQLHTCSLNWRSLPTYPVYASEFLEQCGKSVNIDSTLLAVSQSGETADTIAAVSLCTATRSNRAKLNQRYRLHYDSYFPSLHWHAGRSRNRGCSH